MYQLGDPLNPETKLEPVVRVEAADMIHGNIDEVISKGVKWMVDPGLFPEGKEEDNCAKEK